MVFVTRYHKGYQVSGDVKIIHRYLPQEIGELYIRYLWLVLPFAQKMEALALGKQSVSAQLWSEDWDGKEWTSKRMRGVLKMASMAGLGHELTIHAYREIAIGISRRFMRGSMVFQQEDDELKEGMAGENPLGWAADLQAGHTAWIAGMIYAREMMERSGVVAEMRQHFRASSEDWHRFLGFESAKVEVVDGVGCVDSMGRKRKRCPFEDDADEERFSRRARLKRMDAAEQLRRMMGDGVEFRSKQEEAMKAIQAGESPVVTVMPTGEGKSILFMLPAWVEPGGTTVVVVPLIALRGDMKRRCDMFGIECVEWESTQPPDGAAIILVTPESAVGGAFGTFLNRMRMMRRLDRIVIDECHIILNNGLDFRKYMQELGRLMIVETQMVLLTATLPPTKEAELKRRMGWVKMRVIRAPTVRKNIRYSVVDAGRYSQQRETAKIRELVESVLRQQESVDDHSGKVVIYCNTIPKVKGLASSVAESAGICCEAFHSKVKKGRKKEILEDFRSGLSRVVVATSALGMGVDIPDIRMIIHADEPRSLLDYAQESGRAGRDGLVSDAVIVGWQGQPHEGGDGTVEEEELVRRLMGSRGECRRAVMSEYMDGHKRVACEDGEERCDVCREREEKEREERERVAEEEEGLRQPSEEGEEEWQGRQQQEEEARQQREQQEEDRRQREQQEEERRRQRQQDHMEFRGQDQERGAGRSRFIEQRKSVWVGREEIERELGRWKGICVICMADGLDFKHPVSQCTQEKGMLAEKERQEAQGGISFQAYAGCFKCGVPQDICESFEDNGRGGYRKKQGVPCQFYGVVFGILYGVKYGYSAIWDSWRWRMREQGVDIDDNGRLLTYLGRRKEQWGYQSSALIWEFKWVVERLGNRVE